MGGEKVVRTTILSRVSPSRENDKASGIRMG